MEVVAADHVEPFTNHVSNLIYINRCTGGCSVEPGVNDSQLNTSAIAEASSTLSEYAGTQEVWDEAMTCLREVYAPYAVEIVEVDPGSSAVHQEVMVAGTSVEFGLGANIGGIAPADCDPIDSSLSFVFSNNASNSTAEDLCFTMSQVSARAYGLPDVVFDCRDPLTFLQGCGRRYFRNLDLKCGAAEEEPCNCGAATQNSHQGLLTLFGEGTAVAPPTLEILLPNDGERVDPGSAIFWSAQDPRQILRSELWINGEMVSEIAGHSYDQRLDNYTANLPSTPGAMQVEIRSANDISETATSIDLLVYTPGSAVAGDDCVEDAHCGEGSCAQVGEDKRCALTCDVGDSNSCSDGFTCVASEAGGGVCWVEEVTPGDSGGCCSVAGTKREPLPWLGLGLFLMGIMLIRRRGN